MHQCLLCLMVDFIRTFLSARLYICCLLGLKTCLTFVVRYMVGLMVPLPSSQTGDQSCSSSVLHFSLGSWMLKVDSLIIHLMQNLDRNQKIYYFQHCYCINVLLLPGMRSAMVLSNLLITIGTGLRCIPAEPSTKTL